MNHDETIKRINELVPDMAQNYKDSLYVPIAIGVDPDPYYDVCTAIDNYFEYVPITLAVIFQAIHATMLLLQEDDYKKQESSHDLIDYFSTPEGGVFGPCWNLEKDNFNDQSDETKTFIGGLLNNTE